MSSKSKKILVTGVAGFLGSHLCEKLLSQDCEVLCVDNFYTGTRKNVEPLLSDSRFELMRHDVCFPLYVEVAAIGISHFTLAVVRFAIFEL